MRHRQLGSSELEVSEISLGSWLTYSDEVEFEQTKACIEAAFEAGINFFDTTNVYGRGAAEEAWGEILSERPGDSYVLATKVWGAMSDDPEDSGLSANQIPKQIDASLRRLQTDYVAGGGSGLGAAVAHMVSRGAHVAICGRRPEKAQWPPSRSGQAMPGCRTTSTPPQTGNAGHLYTVP